jgi:shikimate kinase
MIGLTPDRNLILTGYIGSNAPALAQRIAERLRLPFVNVETHIEARAGMPLDTFRNRYGESRLKTLEAEVMQDTVLRRSSVIFVSGRTLMLGDYGQRIRQTGPIICLVATLDAVLQRLHLTLGARYHNPNERALAVGQLKREWAVRKLDGIHELDTTTLSEGEIIEAVIALWQQVAIGR